MKKALLMVLSLVLVVALTIGGTLAYLTDRDSKTNVFTVGDVRIELNEDFEQGATLVPGVNIEKKPTITNTGKNDAWVWLEFAIPSALDNFIQGTDQGSNENVIHWNPKGATTEGYVTAERVKNAIDSGFFGNMDTTNLTADYINTNKMHWNVFNSLGDDENVYQTKIDNVDYNVYVLLYNKALTSGETTLPNIEKVFLDAQIDIDTNGDWYRVVNGTATKLNWNSDTDGAPVIYVSAYAIQTEGFADVKAGYAAYKAQWGDNGGEYAPIPTIAASAEELKDALTTGGTIYLNEDVDGGATVALGAAVDMNLKDNTLTGTVTNNGDLTISEGTIAADGSQAIYNEGNAELKDVTVTMTNSTGYIVNSRTEDSVTIYENVTLTSTGGGVNVWQGEAIFKSGTITTNSTSTSARHVFYVADGAKLTIEDGDFIFSPTNLTRKGSYICAQANAEVIVNGGTFHKPSTRTAPIQALEGSTVTIYGGTFQFDPSAFVADGYEAVENSGWWTVSAK